MDENTDDAAEVIGQAQVRVRKNHKYTQKEGWKHETTVEITAPDNPEAFERLFTEYENMIDRLGREENERRNVSDEGERKYKEMTAA